MGTFAGSTLEIGTTKAATSEMDFSTDTYTMVNGLNNMGELGSAGNVVTFPLVSEDFVKKSKGTRNAGDPAIVCERLPNDPGQIALRLAEETKYYYNFRLTIADAENENMTDTVVYFRALVVGVPISTGGVEDFVTETYTLGIYPRPLILNSAVISSP